MILNSIIALLNLLLLHPNNALAAACSEWRSVQTVGHVPRQLVPEASGLTYSRRWTNHWVWVNDSGNASELILSSPDGKDWQRISVEGVKFRDAEAMTATTCEANEPCWIVGDSGDNKRRRESIQLVTFRERDVRERKVKPWRVTKVKYPDGPHDVEALAALPNGDLILITKEIAMMAALPAQVFRISKSEWMMSKADPIEAQSIGFIPFPEWMPERKFLSTAVTDAAVNLKRSVLGILTYSGLIEIPLTKINDLADASAWKEGHDYFSVPIESLAQQETLAYAVNEDRVIWSSEWFKPDTPIFSMTCARAGP